MFLPTSLIKQSLLLLHSFPAAPKYHIFHNYLSCNVSIKRSTLLAFKFEHEWNKNVDIDMKLKLKRVSIHGFVH